jgi:hypothetical protein
MKKVPGADFRGLSWFNKYLRFLNVVQLFFIPAKAFFAASGISKKEYRKEPAWTRGH